MEQHRWSAWSAGFLAAAPVAFLAGALETAWAPNPEPAGMVDLIYGANVHGLMALGLTLVLRLALWRTPDRRFRAIAFGSVLVLELGLVAPFWLSIGPTLPPLGSPAGKLALIAVMGVGTLLGAAIAWRLDRILPTRSRWGVRLAALMALANAAAVLLSLPRGEPFTTRTDAAQVERPPVVIILIDTLRRDHVSYFGYERNTTPNLDRLLTESYTWTSAVTPSTWTMPSIASLFSGLYPTSHGVSLDRPHLPRQAFTLAECFRAYGYRTGAFVANPIVSARSGYGQGFGTFYPRWPLWWMRSERTIVEHIAKRLSPHGTVVGWMAEIGSAVTETFVRWLSRGAERPLFAYLHYIDPHEPYRPPEPDRRAVAPGAPRGPANAPNYPDLQADDTCFDWECLEDPPRLDPEDLAGMIANYDGEIHRADALLGRALDGMRELGLLDRCHLLLFTDHGEEFGDHGGWNHTYSIYDEISGAVMAYRPPGGLPGGRRIERPVAMLDLTRSLFEILGFDPSPAHQGRLLPEIVPGARRALDRSVLCEMPPYLYSLRLGDWKLIQRGPRDDPDWRLYNLAADPREMRNLARAEPDTLAQARLHLQGLLAALAQVALGMDDDEISPELLRQLETLGYINRSRGGEEELEGE